MYKEATALVSKYKRRKDFLKLYESLKDFTMIAPGSFVTNLEIANDYKNVPGDVVECGCWKGGMMAGMAAVLGKSKNYFLFDSFEGLPEAKEIDGGWAQTWQKNISGNHFHNNCRADESDARNAMQKVGIDNATIIKGWFNETLPAIKFINGISVLRIDGDWYDSTLEVFSNLFRQVNQGGVIIIDDYYIWDGCSRAVHDYLSQNKCIERISIYKDVCYIIKQYPI